MQSLKQILHICREYKGIAEVGGLKEVTYALTKEASRNDIETVCILPLYGFISVEKIRAYQLPVNFQIEMASLTESISTWTAFYNGITFYFIDTPKFRQKNQCIVM